LTVALAEARTTARMSAAASAVLPFFYFKRKVWL
jgi:hypothetical protein